MPQCLARGLPCSEFILFNRRLVISQGMRDIRHLLFLSFFVPLEHSLKLF